MVSEELKSLAVCLNDFAGKVTSDQWQKLRLVRENLLKAAEQVETWESTLPVNAEYANEEAE